MYKIKSHKITVSALRRCVKSVQIPIIFWSVFSRIRTEYGDLLRKSSYSVRIRENTDQKKLRIWTLHTVRGICNRIQNWNVVTKKGSRKRILFTQGKSLWARYIFVWSPDFPPAVFGWIHLSISHLHNLLWNFMLYILQLLATESYVIQLSSLIMVLKRKFWTTNSLSYATFFRSFKLEYLQNCFLGYISHLIVNVHINDEGESKASLINCWQEVT